MLSQKNNEQQTNNLLADNLDVVLVHSWTANCQAPTEKKSNDDFPVEIITIEDSYIPR